MRKYLAVFGLISLLLLCAGCETAAKSPAKAEAPETEAVVETERKAPPAEQVDWDVVSVKAEDFGMEVPPSDAIASTAPLDQLIAFHLVADGLSEGSGDEIYRRFMEAPNTVLTYLALMGEQTVEWPGQGEVCAAEEICRGIASADVAWYDATEEFDAIIQEYREYYPEGRISELLNLLEEEHKAAIARNAAG